MQDDRTELPAEVAPGPLSPAETTRLAELEAVVERGLQTFVQVGLALTEIRDARLYRQEHATFETYARDRWGIGRSRAYQLMEAARVSTVVDVPNERQARELARLGDADRVGRVWTRLRDEHGDAVTAELVRGAVDEELGERPARLGDRELTDEEVAGLSGLERIAYAVGRAEANERQVAAAIRAEFVGEDGLRALRVLVADGTIEEWGFPTYGLAAETLRLWATTAGDSMTWETWLDQAGLL